MSVVKVGITKSTEFQGKIDEFSNIYTYSGEFPTGESLNALLDAVVAAEKPVFSSSVTFVRGRIWGEDGIGRNVMLLTRDLVGPGTANPVAAFYRECAIMVRWPLPPKVTATGSFGNTFKRVSPYLRKYLHLCTSHGYDASGVGPGFAPVLGSALHNYANAVRTPVPGVNLTNDDGVEPTATHQFARYIEHRQFPRGRKES